MYNKIYRFYNYLIYSYDYILKPNINDKPILNYFLFR